MAWTIEVDDIAAKQLKKLGRAESERIRKFLRERLARLDNPRSIGLALTGSELGDLWRYRLGNYRIVCDLQDERLVVLVVRIAHRREVYR